MSIIAAMLLTTITPSFVVGDLKEFGDWVVGCDNARDCHATSLPIDEGSLEPFGDGNLTISIKRSGNPTDPPSVSFTAAGARALDEMEAIDSLMRNTRWIAVDGQKLDIHLGKEADIYELDGLTSEKLIAAMRGKSSVSLLDPQGQPFATASLRGFDAVFGYIDQRQYLTDTVAALGRAGTKPVNAFTVPLMLPRRQVRVAPKPEMPPSTIDHMQLAQLRGLDPCLKYSSNAIQENPIYYRLDTLNTLMVLPTSCGGYNPYRMLYIVDNQRKAQPARFWPYQGHEIKDDSELSNVDWSEEARLLSSFARGRGISDCGESQSFAWHDGRFLLVHDERMYPCRGSTDYITTYHVEVLVDDNVKPVPARSQPAGYIKTNDD